MEFIVLKLSTFVMGQACREGFCRVFPEWRSQSCDSERTSRRQFARNRRTASHASQCQFVPEGLPPSPWAGTPTEMDEAFPGLAGRLRSADHVRRPELVDGLKPPLPLTIAPTILAKDVTRPTGSHVQLTKIV